MFSFVIVVFNVPASSYMTSCFAGFLVQLAGLQLVPLTSMVYSVTLIRLDRLYLVVVVEAKTWFDLTRILPLMLNEIV